MFVAERAKQIFPQAPVPSRHFLRAHEIARLCFQIGLARPVATIPSILFHPIRAAARSICRANFPAASAAIRFRATSLIPPAARRANFSKTKPLEALWHWTLDFGFVFPNDVKNHILEIFILVVAVRAPAARTQINFHVAGARRIIADLQNGVAKIRAAFEAGKAGMKNADDFSAGSFQLAAFEPLVLPNGLKQAFGREIFVAQKICGGDLRTPLRVEIFRGRSHLKLLLRFCRRKVNKLFSQSSSFHCLRL